MWAWWSRPAVVLLTLGLVGDLLRVIVDVHAHRGWAPASIARLIIAAGLLVLIVYVIADAVAPGRRR